MPSSEKKINNLDQYPLPNPPYMTMCDNLNPTSGGHA